MPKPEVQFIAITLADGYLAIMQFVTKQVGVDGWERQPTDEAVNAEIRKALGHDPNQPRTWRFIEESDIPKTREHRVAWRDDGEKIYVDKSLIDK